MKNVLTYYVDHTQFQEELRKRSGMTHFKYQDQIEFTNPELYLVAKHFKKTLEQHGWSVGGDIQYEVGDVIKYAGEQLIALKRITLTFRDETTALLFKLSLCD